MYCTACGGEIDPQGNCPRCAVPGSPAKASSWGDAFLPAPPEKKPNPLLSAVFTILALVCFALVLLLNLLKAMKWAGSVMDPEGFGYMIGGDLVSFALGLLAMYLVNRKRTTKSLFGANALLSMGIALLISVFTLGAEFNGRGSGAGADPHKQMGALLKEAAGKQPRSKDANWWDGPSRDFFQDILAMNQKYSAEVSALDNSAIKDLYSPESYVSKAHMQKVVEQLQAALVVDEKYISIDPLIKKLEDSIASVDISESQKKEFLQGLQGSMDRNLAPRREVIRTEEGWMHKTIALYEFLIEHKSEYSIKNKKLYFTNNETGDEFASQQTSAIAAHKEFLKAKSAMEAARKKNMGELGVSPSDLTPSQLGKPQ